MTPGSKFLPYATTFDVPGSTHPGATPVSVGAPFTVSTASLVVPPELTDIVTVVDGALLDVSTCVGHTYSAVLVSTWHSPK